MTTRFVHYNVTDTEKAIAIGSGHQPDDSLETVIVLSETDEGGLTAGQMAFKHNVPKGETAGTYC